MLRAAFSSRAIKARLYPKPKGDFVKLETDAALVQPRGGDAKGLATLGEVLKVL